MARGAPYLMAGKTGTAQVISRRGTAAINPKSLPMHLRHRSLFVGFAPADAPAIAIAVAVEGGGYGGTTAAPIARKILDAFMLGKMPEGADDPQAASSDPEQLPVTAPPANPATTGTPANPSAAPSPAAPTPPGRAP